MYLICGQMYSFLALGTCTIKQNLRGTKLGFHFPFFLFVFLLLLLPIFLSFCWTFTTRLSSCCKHFHKMLKKMKILTVSDNGQGGQIFFKIYVSNVLGFFASLANFVESLSFRHTLEVFFILHKIFVKVMP